MTIICKTLHSQGLIRSPAFKWETSRCKSCSVKIVVMLKQDYLHKHNKMWKTIQFKRILKKRLTAKADMLERSQGSPLMQSRPLTFSVGHLNRIIQRLFSDKSYLILGNRKGEDFFLKSLYLLNCVYTIYHVFLHFGIKHRGSIG